jgi:hypothetical protein
VEVARTKRNVGEVCSIAVSIEKTCALLPIDAIRIRLNIFRTEVPKLDKRNAVAPFSSYGDIRLARDGESLWCAFVGRKVATGSCLLGGIMPVATRLWRASLTISNVFVVPVRTERALVPSLDDGVGNARHLAGPIRHARHIDVGGLRNP